MHLMSLTRDRKKCFIYQSKSLRLGENGMKYAVHTVNFLSGKLSYTEGTKVEYFHSVHVSERMWKCRGKGLDFFAKGLGVRGQRDPVWIFLLANLNLYLCCGQNCMNTCSSHGLGFTLNCRYLLTPHLVIVLLCMLE
jgi:hypothetical protein